MALRLTCGTVIVVEPAPSVKLGFVFLPYRVLPSDVRTATIDNVVAKLGLRFHCTIAPDRIDKAILATLVVTGESDHKISNLDELAKEHQEVYDWLRSIDNEEIIPLEASPLKFMSKAALAGISIGAAVGFAAAAGLAGPILLITVPAGIVVCGTSAVVIASMAQGMAAPEQTKPT